MHSIYYHYCFYSQIIKTHKMKPLTQFLLIRSQSFIFLIALLLLSCKDKQNDQIVVPALNYDKGVLVLNQGNPTSNNGTISLLERDTKTISYDIFNKANGRVLAGSVIDYVETDGKGVIIVDNTMQGKDVLEIINPSTFKSLASISDGIENPRKVVVVGTNKVYVTCWDIYNNDNNYKAGYVAVVDLSQNKVIKKIPVQNGAEDIVVINTEAFVGNSASGKDFLSVIDLTKDEVKTTIPTGSNPQSLVDDGSGKIWFIANKQLVKMIASTKTIARKYAIATSPLKKIGKLALDPNTGFILYTYYFNDATDNNKIKGEVYAFGINDGNEISADKIIINRVFSGMNFDNKNSILYASLPPNYSQAGYVFRYKLDGTLIDSIRADIAPIKFIGKAI